MPASLSKLQKPLPSDMAPGSYGASRGMNLRTKLLLLVVGLVCTLVAVLVLLGCQAISQAGQTAQEVSRSALEAKVKTHLLNGTIEKAEQTELEIDHAMQKAKWLAKTVGDYFFHPEICEQIGLSGGDANLVIQPQGHHIEGEGEQANLHVSNHVEVNSDLQNHVKFSAYWIHSLLQFSMENAKLRQSILFR